MKEQKPKQVGPVHYYPPVPEWMALFLSEAAHKSGITQYFPQIRFSIDPELKKHGWSHGSMPFPEHGILNITIAPDHEKYSEDEIKKMLLHEVLHYYDLLHVPELGGLIEQLEMPEQHKHFLLHDIWDYAVDYRVEKILETGEWAKYLYAKPRKKPR
jgi:hypothetical protein